MKRDQNTVKNIEKYMDLFKKLNEQQKQEKGRWIFKLSTNPAFLILTIGAGAIGSALAADPLIGIWSIATMVPGGVGGFFLPKFIHKIKANSYGKAGIKYAKHELGSYIDLMYKCFLICHEKVVVADSINEFTDEMYNNFLKDVTTTANTYKAKLDRFVRNKIEKRVDKDLNKIRILLNDSNKNQAKIQKIIDKNRDFIEPWCDVYNEYLRNAKVLTESVYTFAGKRFDTQKYYEDNVVSKDVLAEKVEGEMISKGLKPVQYGVALDDSHKQRVAQINAKKSKSYDSIDEDINIL